MPKLNSDSVVSSGNDSANVDQLVKFDAVQDQDAGLRPDINDLPDNFYLQNELDVRANDEERQILEEIPEPRVEAEPQPLQQWLQVLQRYDNDELNVAFIEELMADA